MWILTAQFPSPERWPSLSGDGLLAVLLVGGLVLLVVGYLIFDWINGRRESRKLAHKQRQAREAWKREQSESEE
jgi:hypothetical protein